MRWVRLISPSRISCDCAVCDVRPMCSGKPLPINRAGVATANIRDVFMRASFSVYVSRFRSGLPERPERCADFSREQLGLFPGREVPALVDLVEVDEIAISAPGPGLGSSVDLVRKHGDGDRQ